MAKLRRAALKRNRAFCLTQAAVAAMPGFEAAPGEENSQCAFALSTANGLRCKPDRGPRNGVLHTAAGSGQLLKIRSRALQIT